eukprot:CAMPEP_0116867302 /NCGR_PEP_ID=MMETSP0418-20121206/26540_1 /TAXON_ID=1158023 /ORGANISM="Astrosyne radiata, Strain 13vi08-1A" /LENGTH=195 /DNA_ID=CAMNT_0004503095 /DNA_START=97 /DNA_END=684 /DNA_ORIENTATION=+
MNLHVVIAPGASHSGFEDHFSADLYHYLHHRYYECNYGAAIPLDTWFGTFRDKLTTTTTTTPSSSATTSDTDTQPSGDGKAILSNILEEPLYQIMGVLVPVLLLLGSNNLLEDNGVHPVLLAWAITLMPIVSAALLYIASSSSKKQPSMWAPFDKETMGVQILHFVLGFVLGVLPVYGLLILVFSPASGSSPSTS